VSQKKKQYVKKELIWSTKRYEELLKKLIQNLGSLDKAIEVLGDKMKHLKKS
jgi:hypothetical protein